MYIQIPVYVSGSEQFITSKNLSGVQRMLRLSCKINLFPFSSKSLVIKHIMRSMACCTTAQGT